MRTRKIVSVMCVLAMLISVFSAFTVTANAELTPTVSLIKTDATLEDGSNLVYDVVFSGMQKDDKISGFSVTMPIADPFTYNKDNVVSDKEITKSDAITAAGTVVINYASASAPFVADDEGKVKVATITLGVDSTKTAVGEEYKVTPSASKVTINETAYASAKGALTIVSDASITIPKPELAQKIVLNMTKAPTLEDKTVTFDIVAVGFDKDAKVSGFSVTMPMAAPFTYNKDKVVSDKEITKSDAITAAGTVVVNYASASAPFIVGEDGTVKLATVTLGIDDDAMAEGSKYSLAPSVAKITVNDVAYASAKEALTIKGFTAEIGSVDTDKLTVTADKTALTLEPGASDAVTLTIKNAEGTPKVTAKSDNTDVTATVSGEKVTVKAGSKAKDGTAKVTVTVKDADDCEATVEITVTVKAKPVEKPAVNGTVETEVKEVAGGVKQTFFTAKFKLADGVTAEVLNTIIKDNETYQVQFDATKGDEAVGYAIINGLAGADVKNALLNGTPITNVSVCIGGANAGKVALLGADGSTIKLPE